MADGDTSEALRKLLSAPQQPAPEQPSILSRLATGAADVGRKAVNVGKSLVASGIGGTGSYVTGLSELSKDAGRDVKPGSTPLPDISPALARGGAAISSAAQALMGSRGREAEEAEAGFHPTVDLTDPLHTFSLGKNPTLYGAAENIANLAGMVAPVSASARVAPGSTTAVGALLGGGMASQAEHERISSMPDEQLALLPGFKSRIASGMSPEQAKADLAESAASSAFRYTAPTGAFTAGAEGALLSKTGQSVLAKLVGTSRAARALAGGVTGGGAGAAYGAAQELGSKEVTGETPDVGRAAGDMALITGPLGALGGARHVEAPRGTVGPQEQEALAKANPQPEAPAVKPGFKAGQVHPVTGEVEVAPHVLLNPDAGLLSRTLSQAAVRGDMDRQPTVAQPETEAQAKPEKPTPAVLDQIILERMQQNPQMDGAESAKLAKSLGVSLMDVAKAKKRFRNFLEANAEENPTDQSLGVKPPDETPIEGSSVLPQGEAAKSAEPKPEALPGAEPDVLPGAAEQNLAKSLSKTDRSTGPDGAKYIVSKNADGEGYHFTRTEQDAVTQHHSIADGEPWTREQAVAAAGQMAAAKTKETTDAQSQHVAEDKAEALPPHEDGQPAAVLPEKPAADHSGPAAPVQEGDRTSVSSVSSVARVGEDKADTHERGAVADATGGTHTGAETPAVPPSEQGAVRRPELRDDRTGIATAPTGWQRNIVKARQYAKALGIDRAGKKLADLVPEIQRAEGEANAVATGEKPPSGKREHPAGDQSGPATETGGGDRAAQREPETKAVEPKAAEQQGSQAPDDAVAKRIKQLEDKPRKSFNDRTELRELKRTQQEKAREEVRKEGQDLVAASAGKTEPSGGRVPDRGDADTAGGETGGAGRGTAKEEKAATVDEAAKRESGQGAAGNVERRTHPEERKAVEAMTPDERASEIAKLRERNDELERHARTSELTGLRNHAAFKEDAKLGWQHVAAIDMDGLKRANETLGHNGADGLLRALGAHLKGLESEGVRFYHRSGDEFQARYRDAQGKSVIEQAQHALDNTHVDVEDANGKHFVYEGIGISVGHGDNHATEGKGYEQADEAATANKAARLASGKRQEPSEHGAPRRLKPKPAAGLQTGKGDAERAAVSQAAELPAGQVTAEQHLADITDEHFKALRSEIGWDQIGGQLLRAPLKDGEGALGEVVGRTQWVGRVGPNGESNFWRNRPVKFTEKAANKAFDKYASGEKLNVPEQRFIAYAKKVAEIYAKDEIEARQLADAHTQAQRTEAIQRAHDDYGVTIKDADNAESAIVIELAQRAREAGMHDMDVERFLGEANKDYAGRLWREIQNLGGDRVEQRAAQETRAGDAQGDGQRQAATADFKLEAERPKERPAPEGEKQQDLIAPATSREATDAAARAKEEALRGGGKTVVGMRAGAGELFAGARPEQAAIPEAKPSEKAKPIEDFGEKIHGARKDYAHSYADAVKEGAALETAAHPLSKTWPEPDYAKLIEGGTDAKTVAFVHAMRDEIPTKPSTSWKLAGWVNNVETLRGFADRLLSGEITPDKLDKALSADNTRSLRAVVGRAELYAEVGHETSLKGVSFAEHHYSLYRGEKNVTKWAIERRGRSSAFSNWPEELSVANTKQEAIDGFKKKLGELSGEGQPERKAPLVIYSRKFKKGEFTIGVKLRGGDALDLKSFTDIKAARTYLADHRDELTAQLTKMRDVPNERKQSNSPRVGVDYRNGADITPERFNEDFGFRGVQFGNYVEGARRQNDLNQAYDALHDLAAVIGVPTQALSLDGKLGLAFGARGHGGKNAAAAHYESGKVVINLTKGAGAGSLAHEWWHSLDNYFGKLRGQPDSFLTATIKKPGSSAGDVRQEMMKAFDNVISTIKKTGVMERSKGLDKLRSKDYWSTDHEMSARAFESYVISKLEDQSAGNDYLANVVSEKTFAREGGYPYPTAAEIPAVRAAFDEFFNTIESKSGEGGKVALFSKGTEPAGVAYHAHTTELRKAIEQATERWGDNAPKLHVVDTPEQFPARIKADPNYSKAKGAYDPATGEAWIAASNHKDVESALRAVAHEAVGHHGIESILDDHVKGGWDKLTVDIAKMRSEGTGGDAMQSVLRDVERRYGAESDAVKAKETLAVMAERGMRNGIMARVYAAVRAFVRKLMPSLKFETADLNRLLAKSDEFLRSDTRGETGVLDAPAFSQSDVTQTPAFQKFFGDSKIVDKEGKPKVLYHGTGESFNVFAGSKLGEATQHATAPLGFHFTDDRVRAEHYAENSSERPVDQRVISAYLKIDKPYDMTLKQAHAIETPAQAKAFRAKLERQGYDGIRLPEAKSVIAFRPEQIKSATENSGRFDAKNPDIRFSLPADEAAALKKSVADLRRFAQDDRQNARGDIRAAFARSAREVGSAAAALDSMRKSFDTRVAQFKGDYRKLYAGISALERGEKIDDPLVNAFWRATRPILKNNLDRANALGADISDVANYLSHIWKNQGQAMAEDVAKVENQPSIGGRRPLAGSKYFTKERVFSTMEEGINAGREPVSANPVDMFIAHNVQMNKLISALTIKKDFDGRGFIKPIEGDRVPTGYARVNDGVFAGKALPELIATDLNNHLDPGLTRFDVWRKFRYAQNLLLSARLGLSMFHAGMTTLDQMATHIQIGALRVTRGDLSGAMHELWRASISPVTTIRELFGKGEGSKLMRQWFGEEAADANTAALLHMAMEGGARAHMSSVDYNAALSTYRQAWRQGDVRNMALHVVPAAIEASTHAIARNLVPAQKMTARVMLLKFRLDDLSEKLGVAKGDYAGAVKAMAPDAMRQLSRQINADVDDRLGQFAYENEFWNKTVKDALHASVQSVGWNFGSLRLLGGSVADIAKLGKPEAFRGPLDAAGNIQNAKMSRLTGRLGYLITLNAVVAAMGAMTQMAMTGQGPQETKDYFYPKTGRKNADDSDERLAFPSYVKDEYAFSHQPLQTIQHKLHPSISMLAEIAQNKDFYGTQLFDPEATLPVEAKQFLEYVGKSFFPYSLQGATKNKKSGDSLAMTALPFIGITPAAGSVSKSPFQAYVAQKYFDSLPQGARSQEKAEASGRYSDAVNALRRGEQPDTTDMTPYQIRSLYQRAGIPLPQSSFTRLDIVSQIRAFKMASEDEKEKYHLQQIMTRRASARIAKLPPSQRADVQRELSAAIGQ